MDEFDRLVLGSVDIDISPLGPLDVGSWSEAECSGELRLSFIVSDYIVHWAA